MKWLFHSVRHSLKVYLNKKPKKRGYKVWTLAGRSGSLYKIQLYGDNLATDPTDLSNNIGESGKIVLLSKGCERKELFCDNFFASVDSQHCQSARKAGEQALHHQPPHFPWGMQHPRIRPRSDLCSRCVQVNNASDTYVPCVVLIACMFSVTCSRRYRHTAYYQFVIWIWHRLGRRNRKPLPSCAVLQNRCSFPSQHYTSFTYAEYWTA